MKPPSPQSQAFDATCSAWLDCWVDTIPLGLHGLLSGFVLLQLFLIGGQTKAALFYSLMNGFCPGLQDWFQRFVASRVGVKRCHDLGALADRGGDALYGFCPYVTDGENTPSRRFQSMPAATRVVARKHKALGIQRNARTVKPVSVGFGADK